MDVLTRAWNVLEPGERPEGMEWHDVLDGWSDRGCWMPDHTAYDRLVVAVEDALLASKRFYNTLDRSSPVPIGHPDFSWDYVWHTNRDDPASGGERGGGWNLVFRHTCRLTAAVLALESERGSDA